MDDANEPLDEVEAEVQRIVAEIELSRPEVQAAICTRLLEGLASRLTPAVVTKAVSAAKTGSVLAKKAAPRARTARRDSGEQFARIDSQLARLADPTDPVMAWNRFGRSADSLREVLRQEPLGALEAMLLHDNMPKGPRPRGKSREVLTENIVSRLEQHFQRGW